MNRLLHKTCVRRNGSASASDVVAPDSATSLSGGSHSSARFGRSTRITTGIRMASIDPTNAPIASPKPPRVVKNVSAGAVMTPPAVAPFNAQLTARPRRRQTTCEPGRCLCQDIALLAQSPVLTPQTGQLLALGAGRAVLTPAFVAISLSHPVPDRLGGRFELARQRLRAAPGSNQINHLTPEFRCIGSMTLRN